MLAVHLAVAAVSLTLNTRITLCRPWSWLAIGARGRPAAALLTDVSPWRSETGLCPRDVDANLRVRHQPRLAPINGGQCTPSASAREPVPFRAAGGITPSGGLVR